MDMDIDKLLTEIQSGTNLARAHAAIQLGKFGSKYAIPCLIDVLVTKMISSEAMRYFH